MMVLPDSFTELCDACLRELDDIDLAFSTAKTLWDKESPLAMSIAADILRELADAVSWAECWWSTGDLHEGRLEEWELRESLEGARSAMAKVRPFLDEGVRYLEDADTA